VPGSCCAKPITRKIRVADFEAGLIGLDQAILNVYTAGVTSDEEIKKDLLTWVRDFGNYVTPSREQDYKHALLREYKAYVEQSKKDDQRSPKH
jgi:hypothetical protein